LLLFSSFTVVLQLYYCSPALQLLSSVTKVKLEKSSKAGEQENSSRTVVKWKNNSKAEEQHQSWRTTVKMGNRNKAGEQQ
jgi:hypothetical protein